MSSSISSTGLVVSRIGRPSAIVALNWSLGLFIALALGAAFGTSRRGTLIIAALIVAACLAVAVLANARYMKSPLPTRIVPIGLSSAFSQRLTGSSIIIGRSPHCDISLPLLTVSLHHCRIHRSGHYWYVEDLASRNGTQVNGVRVNRKRLRVGDVISVGEIRFTIE